MPHARNTRARSLAGALAALLPLALAAAAAEAAPKGSTVQTEAKWVSFNPDKGTVTVKIVKPTKGGTKIADKKLNLKTGKEVYFNVKAEGSVLSKTTVAINGKKGEFKDIGEGKTVNIYWIADEKQEGARFARKIDVILSDEELDALYAIDPKELEKVESGGAEED